MGNVGREAYEYKIRTGATWAEVEERFGISRKTARSYYEDEGLPPPSEVRKQNHAESIPDIEGPELDEDTPPKDEADTFGFRVDGLGATGYAQGKRIRSLEQLKANILANGGDLDPWRVKQHVVNVWEMGRKEKVVDITWQDGVATGFVKDTGGWSNKANWQVKAWFVPREDYPLAEAVDDIMARLLAHSPRYDPPAPVYSDGAHLSVWSLFDAHFGKRSADGSYTLAQAKTDFMRAGERIAEEVQTLNKPIRRILLPIGQDALHADNLAGTTTKGTWVEIAADMRDAIDALTEALVYVVEVAATIAPVDLLAIEDNHARFSSYWLGKFAEAWFRNHPRVTVDAMRAPRKYYQFGKVLLGIDHGDNVKAQDLALKMAIEAPQMWAETEHREWLRGHLHKRAGMYHPANEESGVMVRWLPALCPADEWHVMKGFIGNHRAAEGLFYHADYGPAGSFPVFVD